MSKLIKKGIDEEKEDIEEREFTMINVNGVTTEKVIHSVLYSINSPTLCSSRV